MFRTKLFTLALVLVGGIAGTLAVTDTAEARPRVAVRGGYYGGPVYRPYTYRYRAPARAYYNRPYVYRGYPYGAYPYGYYRGGGVYIGRGGISIGW
jgi:hypothetical protein